MTTLLQGIVQRLRDARMRRTLVALAAGLVALALIAMRLSDSVNIEALRGCWDQVESGIPNQPAAQLCFAGANLDGQLDFASDELTTFMSEAHGALYACRATGVARIAEVGDWRRVALRTVALTGTGMTPPVCNTVTVHHAGESIDPAVDYIGWDTMPHSFPTCRYERADDSIVCGSRTLRRRQATAAAVTDGAHCGTVSAVLGSGVLPDDRAIKWQTINRAFCPASAPAAVAAPPPAPTGAERPSLAAAVRAGCYAAAVDESYIETFCFGARANTAIRMLVGQNASACTAPIRIQPSAAPWQFQFTLTWNCTTIDDGRRHGERQIAGLRTRYCALGAEGRLTCSWWPRQPGMVYADATMR